MAMILIHSHFYDSLTMYLCSRSVSRGRDRSMRQPNATFAGLHSLEPSNFCGFPASVSPARRLLRVAVQLGPLRRQGRGRTGTQTRAMFCCDGQR